MKIHETEEVTYPPYFRRMKVESGYLYNFWDSDNDDYSKDWVFVPVNFTAP
tara:strand:+ start:549 stop:701 length:153 start_codon:yes stop_codon:yes gene_type:complete